MLDCVGFYFVKVHGKNCLIGRLCRFPKDLFSTTGFDVQNNFQVTEWLKNQRVCRIPA